MRCYYEKTQPELDYKKIVSQPPRSKKYDMEQPPKSHPHTPEDDDE